MSDPADTDREQPAFDVAMDVTHSIVADLNHRWETRASLTRLSFKISKGTNGEPVFAFALLLDLVLDFDPADWPADQVEQRWAQI